MGINLEGLELIQRFEGLRLQAYQDVAGVWTIGYGHTRTARPAMTITEADARALLRKDVENAEADVTRAARVPLNENEFAALVSWTFNLGGGNLQRSTMLKRLNAGDRDGAAAALTWWNMAGGEVLRGLVLRREAEKTLFLKPVYDPAAADPATWPRYQNSRICAVEENRPHG